MFNMQLINRVGWDGMVKPPDPNELGWKETIRMNPLEDAIVALRPITPSLPFQVPNSIRPMDVTSPIGSTMGFTNIDPNGNPVTVTNQLVNYGWEYVWHCHLLGHEENDMMRPMIIGVAPNAAPFNLSGTVLGFVFPTVQLTWVIASNVSGFTIQRATDPGFTTNLQAFTVGMVTTYSDNTVARNVTYYYRVFASNVFGGVAPGAPSMTMNSNPSNVIVVSPPAIPTNVTATQPGTQNNGPVVVTWKDNSPSLTNPPNFNAETSFTVQRATGVNGPWITIALARPPSPGTGLTVTYTDNGTRRRTTYYYRIIANNVLGSLGSSLLSNPITTR
jgi:hypothetical protein